MALWQIETTVYDDSSGQMVPVMSAPPGTYPEPQFSFNSPFQQTTSDSTPQNPPYSSGSSPSVGFQEQPSTSDVDSQLEDAIASIVEDYVSRQDEVMNNMGLTLTEGEVAEIERNALEFTKPFFEKEKKNLLTSIKNDEIKNAEDLLFTIKTDIADFGYQLKNISLEDSQSEEEFANTLADITGEKQYAIKEAQQTWMEKIRDLKQTQVEKGVLTGGRGKERVSQMETRRQRQLDEIRRMAQQRETTAQTKRKFDKGFTKLAREKVEEERRLTVGTPEQQQTAITGARETLGLTGSAEIAPRRQTLSGRANRERAQFEKEKLQELTQKQEERRLQQEIALKGEKRIQKQTQLIQALEGSRQGLSEDLRKRLGF